MEVKSILPAMAYMFFLKGKGTLKGERKRREEGKVNNSSKNAYRAEVVHSYQHSNLRS